MSASSPLATALEIGVACDAVRRLDSAELARRAVPGGNPVVPLVREIRHRVEVRAGADAARRRPSRRDEPGHPRHRVDARRQAGRGRDRRGRRRRRRQLRDARPRAPRHRDGRSHAAAGGRADHLRRGRRRLGERARPQRRAPGGRCATCCPPSSAAPPARCRCCIRTALPCRQAFADELDLAVPDGVWHADRTVVTDLAGALGTAAAAIGKTAGDLVLLAQTEVGEVSERSPGGSSAMAAQAQSRRRGHRTCRRCASSRTGRDPAGTDPGTAARRRAAGTRSGRRCSALLRFTGGAAARLRVALDLDVHPDAMARNLAALTDVDVTTSATPATWSTDILYRRSTR